jgi:hypothetical protein
LQQGGEPLSGSGIEAAELYSGVLLGDLLLVRQAIERVAALASEFPGWVPILLYGQAAYASLQSYWNEAVAFIESALRLVQPGKHAVFPKLAALHVQALSALGRPSDAAQLGAAYQAQLEAEEVVRSTRGARGHCEPGQHSLAGAGRQRTTSHTALSRSS